MPVKTPEGTIRTAIITVDDDPGVSRAVARDLRRRYGDTVLDLVLEPQLSGAILDELRRIHGVTQVTASDGTLKVALADAPEATGHVVTVVTRHARVVRIDQHEPGLEEVFLQLTGRELRD